MDIISRADAHAAGKLRYFTGIPCRNGHLAERYVTQGACVDCLKKFRKFAPNPYTRKLVPWQPQQLYIPAGLTVDQETQLKDCLRVWSQHWAEQCGLLDEEQRQAYNKREAWIQSRRAAGVVET